MPQPSPQIDFSKSTSVGAGNVILLVLLLVGILFAAYYTTRLVSGKASRLLRSNKMHIVDRLAISRDKMLLIVRVGQELYLLGVSNNQINHLAQLSPEALEEPEDEAGAAGSTFWSRFSGAMKDNFSTRIGRAKKNDGFGPDAYGDLDGMADMVRKRNERYGRHDGGDE